MKVWRGWVAASAASSSILRWYCNLTPGTWPQSQRDLYGGLMIRFMNKRRGGSSIHTEKKINQMKHWWGLERRKWDQERRQEQSRKREWGEGQREWCDACWLWERLCSALLCSVPPGSHTASPLDLKEAMSPWQPERTCARLPAHRAGLYVCMHECVLRKHIGSSPLCVCLRLMRHCHSVGVCVCVNVCFFKSIKYRHVCARGRHTLVHTHTHTHRTSHSQFVLQALFLARGTYIIRVTLGGNKRKGRKHLSHFLYPLSVVFALCFTSSTFSLSCFLSVLCYIFLFPHPSFILSGLFSPVLPASLYIWLQIFSSLLLLLSSCVSACFPHPSSVFLFSSLTSIPLRHDNLCRTWQQERWNVGRMVGERMRSREDREKTRNAKRQKVRETD